jgi:hypothetical protein
MPTSGRKACSVRARGARVLHCILVLEDTIVGSHAGSAFMKPAYVRCLSGVHLLLTAATFADVSTLKACGGWDG